jgi:hypothetical protein
MNLAERHTEIYKCIAAMIEARGHGEFSPTDELRYMRLVAKLAEASRALRPRHHSDLADDRRGDAKTGRIAR